MTLEAIQAAIEELPLEDQTSRDFSAGGRGMPLLAELEQEIEQA